MKYVIALVALLALNAPAAADDKRDCVEASNPDQKIRACTSLLLLNPDLAASVYGHRGSAYLDKEDYDKAIADFDRAIRLGLDKRFVVCTPFDRTGSSLR